MNIGMLLVLLIISLIRGKGDGTMVGIKRCSTADWVFFGILILIAVIITGVALIILRKEYAHKVLIGYTFLPGDLECNPRIVIKLVTMAFLGGFASGSLGIGIGMIFNPLLI